MTPKPLKKASLGVISILSLTPLSPCPIFSPYGHIDPHRSQECPSVRRSMKPLTSRHEYAPMTRFSMFNVMESAFSKLYKGVNPLKPESIQRRDYHKALYAQMSGKAARKLIRKLKQERA